MSSVKGVQHGHGSLCSDLEHGAQPRTSACWSRAVKIAVAALCNDARILGIERISGRVSKVVEISVGLSLRCNCNHAQHKSCKRKKTANIDCSHGISPRIIC